MIGSRSLVFFVVPVALAAAFATGCSDKPAAAPTTQTTSANVTPTADQVARLERERNEAYAALNEEKAARVRERQQGAADSSNVAERDQLELRALTAIESADIQLEQLRKRRLNAANPAERKSVEGTITAAEGFRAAIYANLKKLHAESTGQNLDALRQDTDATIAKLQQAMGSDRVAPNTVTPKGAEPVQAVPAPPATPLK